MLDEQEPKIHCSGTDRNRRYSASVPGFARQTELTITNVKDTLANTDHTFVVNHLHSHRLAQRLVGRLTEGAHKTGQRIVAFCPSVKSYAQKSREGLIDVNQ